MVRQSGLVFSKILMLILNNWVPALEKVEERWKLRLKVSSFNV